MQFAATPIATALAMLGLPGLALAQIDAAEVLPTITVNSVSEQEKRAAQRIDESRKTIAQRAGGTAVIDSADYRQGRAATLSDTLSYAPGIYVNTRHGDDTRFSIRGSGIQRGFLLRGIVLYQDGIPLNYADGAGDFQSIDPLSAEYIEVWRGANALEYGGNTLGGAVNFVSPTGYTAPSFSARAQAGSFGMRQGQIALAGVQDNLDGYLSVSHNEQDGYRVNSATRATRISGNVGMQISPNLKARLFLTHVDSDMQMPGSISKAAMLADPRQAYANSVAMKAGNNYTMDRLALKVDWSASERLTWSTALFVSDRDRYHPMTFGATGSIMQQKARDTGIDTRAVFDLAEGKLTRKLVLGAAYMRFSANQRSSTNMSGSTGALTANSDLVGRQYTFYGEYSHGLTEDWILQFGAQSVRAEREATNILTPSASYNRAFSGLNPKLGLLHQLSPQSQLYTNISRSFEAPPFGETSPGVFLNVAAQKATTIEAGYRHRAGEVVLDAAIYHARIKGELLALTTASGTPLGTVNADRTIHQGVEFSAQSPVGTQSHFRANYLYNDFHFDNDVLYGNQQLAGIAPHVLRSEFKWQPSPKFFIAPNVEWLAGKTWIDHANTVSQSGYALLGVTVGGKLTQHLRWFVDGRNLTDRRYVASTAVRANAQIDAPSAQNYYFPGDGRAVYAGLEWRM